LTTERDALSSSVSELREQLGAATTRQAAAEKAQAEVQASSGKQVAEMKAALRSATDAAAKQASEQAVALKASLDGAEKLQGTVLGLEKKVKSLRADLARSEAKMSKAEETISTTRNALKEAKKEAAAETAALKAALKRVESTARDEAKTLKAQAEDATRRADRVEQDLAVLQQELLGIQTELEPAPAP
jgi:chromosome segregation ATPase